MDSETKAYMREVAEESANKAVEAMLTRLGIDITKPIEIQKDFAALREMRLYIESPEYQADQLYVRKWRKTMEAVQGKGVMTAVGMLVVFIIGSIMVGAKQKLGL